MRKQHPNQFKVKKIFSSLLLSYGALLMVPLLIVFILVGFWDTSTENYYKEIMKNNLTEGRMAFEKRLDVLHAGAFAMLYDRELRWVSYLEGLKPGDSNVSILMNCNEKLNKAFADSTQYYNYCVILSNDFVFRKKGMCVGKEFLYNNYRNYAELSYEEWYQKSFETVNWLLIPMQQIETEDSVEEAMTYSYSIRGDFRQDGEADAVVQFLLSKQDVTDMFSALKNMQGTVYIFDASGECLARIPDDTGTQEQLMPEDLPEAGKCEIQTRNGVEELVMCQESENGELIFAVAVPTEVALMNARQAKKIAWIVLAVGISFEIALGWRFAMRFSGPIRNVVNNMHRLFAADAMSQKEPVPGREISEYEFLEKGVNALMDTNQSMQHILREKSMKERRNFLTLLFNGEFRTPEEIREEAEHVGVDLTAPCHYVLVLHKESEQGQLMEFIENCGYSFIKASYIENLNKTVLLIACDEAKPEETEYNRRLLQEGLAAAGIRDVYAGIGRAYANIVDITFSFRQACYCADKAVREKEQSSAVEYGHALLGLDMPWYPDAVEKKLMDVTRCGKTEDVREIFTKLREENLQKRHLTWTVGKMLTSNITATLLEMYTNMAFSDNVTEIVAHTQKEDNPENTLRLLEQHFLDLSGQINASRDKKTEQYYERIKVYMEENYHDAQFGMAVAAGDFGLSESYFSTFFKETMGKAFSSYLENMRLEKSKVLISEGKYDLEQISRMVGYSSSATFRRAFKRAYGVAPSVWKS